MAHENPRHPGLPLRPGAQHHARCGCAFAHHLPICRGDLGNQQTGAAVRWPRFGQDHAEQLVAGSNGPVVLPFPRIGAPSAVAVDGAGRLCVTDQQNNQVMKLAPGSNLPTVVPFTNLKGPDSIAVDTTGNLYVGNVYSNQVFKLSAKSASVPSNSATPDTSTATTQPTITQESPALGDPCSDWAKLATDPSTAQEMVCGANTSPATQFFWIRAPQLSSGEHVAGTACPGAPQM